MQVRSFDAIIDFVDDGRVPIEVNTAKLIEFLAEGYLPQEVQQLFRQQCAAFLERVGTAGDEATLIREYLGDLIIGKSNSADLPKSLAALTGKPLVVEKSLKHVRTWIRAVVA